MLLSEHNRPFFTLCALPANVACGISTMRGARPWIRRPAPASPRISHPRRSQPADRHHCLPAPSPWDGYRPGRRSIFRRCRRCQLTALRLARRLCSPFATKKRLLFTSPSMRSLCTLIRKRLNILSKLSPSCQTTAVTTLPPLKATRIEPLPARLLDAWDQSSERPLAETYAAQLETTHEPPWAPADATAIAHLHLVLPTILTVDETQPRHKDLREFTEPKLFDVYLGATYRLDILYHRRPCTSRWVVRRGAAHPPGAWRARRVTGMHAGSS